MGSAAKLTQLCVEKSEIWCGIAMWTLLKYLICGVKTPPLKNMFSLCLYVLNCLASTLLSCLRPEQCFHFVLLTGAGHERHQFMYTENSVQSQLNIQMQSSALPTETWYLKPLTWSHEWAFAKFLSVTSKCVRVHCFNMYPSTWSIFPLFTCSSTG